MKILKLITILLIASFAARADLAAVTVPATMLHAPGGQVTGFSGKVQYTLAPLTNDSVYVTLSIVPSAGGAALTLTSVTGDVGDVRINTNIGSTPQTFSIFFETAAPQAGVQYVARIIANAVTSTMQADIQTRISALSKATRASLCGDIDKFQSASAAGVPAFYMNDGPYGWNSGWGNSNDHATCFPACVNEACTWDTSLAHLQGRTKAEDWRAKGRDCALGPGMTLIYHPRCGRSA
jgi:hypothetical protein